jgi:hypothetical protein
MDKWGSRRKPMPSLDVEAARAAITCVSLARCLRRAGSAAPGTEPGVCWSVLGPWLRPPMAHGKCMCSRWVSGGYRRKHCRPLMWRQPDAMELQTQPLLGA